MRTLAIGLMLLFAATPVEGQRRSAKPLPSKTTLKTQTAVTSDGRTVLLKSDGTWEYVVANSTNDRDHTNVKEGLKALRMMASATEVGISFEEYGRRIIDVKTMVDTCLTNLPESDLKKEMELSVAAYVDAGKAWNEFVRRRRSVNEDSLYPDSDRYADGLQKKYQIPTETLEVSGSAIKPFRVMTGSAILNTIWSAAKAHLAKAEKLATDLGDGL